MFALALDRPVGFLQYDICHALRNGHCGHFNAVPYPTFAGFEGVTGCKRSRPPASGGRPSGGLPKRTGNAIFPSGAFLDRTHSFWTYRAVMFMASSMILFAVPFSPPPPCTRLWTGLVSSWRAPCGPQYGATAWSAAVIVSWRPFERPYRRRCTSRTRTSCQSRCSIPPQSFLLFPRSRVNNLPDCRIKNHGQNVKIKLTVMIVIEARGCRPTKD